MTLAKTDRYYHQPEDIFYLKIRSQGDTDRVLRVVLTDGVEKRGMVSGYEVSGPRDPDLTGLVVEDLGTEDSPHAAPVIQYAFSDQPELARKAFERLKTADWSYLVDFLLGANDDLPHASPSAYLKNMPEIEDILSYQIDMREAREAGREFQPDENYYRLLEAPEPGDMKTLLDAGILTLDDEPDLRTEEMKRIDADESIPYSFPKIGRYGIIDDIEARGQVTGRREAYLGWYLDDSFERDFSGKEGGYEVSSDFDQRWAGYVEDREDELDRRAMNEVYNDWKENLYTTYPGEDQGSYEFLTEREQGYVLLKSIDGEDLEITPNRPIRDICNGLPDDTLVKLWKVCRSLDHDLRGNVLADWKAALSFIRYNKEEQWQEELSATSAPGM